MTLRTDVKFEEKLTVDSKKDMRNLVNFHSNTQSRKKSLQWASFVQVV